MAITTTWSIQDMKRDVASGGVKLVYWSCVAADDTHTECAATEGGKLRLEPDATAAGFVAYDDLTEETVLGWVYDSLIEGEETADEAKARIAANRTGKVEAQVARKTAEADGTPWAAAVVAPV
ncbi:hypothetical protein N9E36_02810 [bacterium]|nr:hypothetical protein [bacterium]